MPIIGDTGFVNLSTFVSDSAVGSVSWSNPGNAEVSDDSRATSAIGRPAPGGAAGTNYLKATGPILQGHGAPPGGIWSGAKILGIEVRFERHGTLTAGGFVRDGSIKIVKGGVVSGNEKSANADWPSSDAYVTFGGPTDLWGLSWVASDIGANFGFAVSASLQVVTDTEGVATALIDHMQVRIYYDSSSGFFMVL